MRLHERTGRWLVMAGFATLLVACARQPAEATFTVDYYRTHAPEREAQLRECANDPGAVGDTARCVNAREALRLESVGSLRDLPSMGLSAGEPGNEAPGSAEASASRPAPAQ